MKTPAPKILIPAPTLARSARPIEGMRVDAIRVDESLASDQGSPLMRLLLALLLIILMAGLGLVGVEWEPRLLPIRAISVDGELHGLSRDSLQRTLVEQIDGGLLSQDLRALQAAVEALPWIKAAEVRRLWPDRLALQVTEHEPLARWGEEGLVSAKGEVFRPLDGKLPAGLVRLEGPDEAAPLVVARFRDWQPRLAELGLVVESLSRDARGDWRIGLLGGTEIRVGTRDPDTRLARLMRAYPQLESIASPASIDLRYSHGFAVRWVPTTKNDERIERLADNHRRAEI